GRMAGHEAGTLTATQRGFERNFTRGAVDDATKIVQAHAHFVRVRRLQTRLIIHVEALAPLVAYQGYSTARSAVQLSSEGEGSFVAIHAKDQANIPSHVFPL